MDNLKKMEVTELGNTNTLIINGGSANLITVSRDILEFFAEAYTDYKHGVHDGYEDHQ
jgi:hypothetical protein